MSITNYTQLKTAVANFLARSDLTDRIPEFISLAEGRLSRELESRSQEKRANATLTANDEFVALPTDLREVRHVKLLTSPNTVLEYKSPVTLESEFGGTTGKPRAYTIVGGEIQFRPVPDTSYNAQIIYVGSISALSDSNLVNTILTRHPDAYLSGALTEAYTYLMDEQRAQIYDTKFTRAIEEIKRDEERSQYGTGTLQMTSIYQRQNSAGAN